MHSSGRSSVAAIAALATTILPAPAVGAAVESGAAATGREAASVRAMHGQMMQDSVARRMPRAMTREPAARAMHRHMMRLAAS